MILFSHPTGNANVRHAALGLHRAGLLGEYWTCLNYRPDSWWNQIAPPNLLRQLKRRSVPTEIQPYVHTYPYFEFGRMIAPRIRLGSLTRHERGPLSVDAVYRSLDRRVCRRMKSSNKFSGVYAYEDGAADTFREARKRGICCFYDQPIGYWRAARKLLLEEAERTPEWASTLIGNEDSPEKSARKDEELALADVVFAASSYTLSTLAEAPHMRAAPILIPYGAPPRPADAPVRAARKSEGPLRIIFVGSLGQRKGLSYLFEAVAQLAGAVEMTVIGTLPLERCLILENELKRVRYIPSLPHAQVLAEMAQHDVFVFPSLFEGFGLVLLEAMAMGLPIITTAHTAGPDLIENGKEGFIIPIRSSAALVEKLDLLRREPELLELMGAAAMQKSRTFTWENYGRTLAARVREACQRPPKNSLIEG